MISIIVPAYREEKTIGRAVEAILSQISALKDECELILVCPDEETRSAAEKVVSQFNFQNFVYIKDTPKAYGGGKIGALNLAFKQARGDIFICTDGDVYVDEGSLSELVKPFEKKRVGGVTGRPVCMNKRDSLFGYWGHMFMDAAHKKRSETLGKGEFYVMSGYLLALRNFKFEIPDGVLDDVYISYKIKDLGYDVAYASDARVVVKQPSNLKDWLKQKVRSVAGDDMLRKYFPNQKESRSIWGDVAYLFFPIQYASSLKEFLWSLLQYPLRLYIWLSSWWKTRIEGKRSSDIWERTVSSK